MRTVAILMCAALIAAPLSSGSMSPTNMLRDGLVAHIDFKAQVGATVLVDVEGSLTVHIQAFHRLAPFDKYLPFNATLRLDLLPLVVGGGADLPGFSDEGALTFTVFTDVDGRATVVIPGALFTEADVSASVFLVVLSHCPNDPDVCTTTAFSITTNVLLSLGLHAIADVSEYEEPNSGLRPTATPVTLLLA